MLFCEMMKTLYGNMENVIFIFGAFEMTHIAEGRHIWSATRRQIFQHFFSPIHFSYVSECNLAKWVKALASIRIRKKFAVILKFIQIFIIHRIKWIRFLFIRQWDIFRGILNDFPFRFEFFSIVRINIVHKRDFADARLRIFK